MNDFTVTLPNKSELEEIKRNVASSTKRTITDWEEEKKEILDSLAPIVEELKKLEAIGFEPCITLTGPTNRNQVKYIHKSGFVLQEGNAQKWTTVSPLTECHPEIVIKFKKWHEFANTGKFPDSNTLEGVLAYELSQNASDNAIHSFLVRKEEKELLEEYGNQFKESK